MTNPTWTASVVKSAKPFEEWRNKDWMIGSAAYLYTISPKNEIFVIVLRIRLSIVIVHGIIVVVSWYAVNGQGIEYRWGEIFRTRADWSWDPPSLLYNWYRVFSGDTADEVGLWSPTHIKRRGESYKTHSYKLLPLLGLRSLFYGEIYILLLFLSLL